MSFHSEFVVAPNLIGNLALLPIRTKFRGPAPSEADDARDIIDEAIYYFKPLIFFRQYEIKSEADRVLVYLVLYILECLRKLSRCANKAAGAKELTSLAIARFDLPGDPSFPSGLNSMYSRPKNAQEADQMRAYFTQLRQETGSRILDKVFAAGDQAPPSKWWLCFAKRKFLDQSLSAPGSY